ncbi:LysR family transcriptional regulator [Phaeovulum sp.]|uniref:LysR family transcriptional regulator n=1 Tax=Phaeovulum sp. TaxID=2934796 RepID=UPI00272F7B66|nr:LysR family transcriptional regulator [Phaeovulum sp.]MDP1669159.1 LysR family transcriptional regulator [Phaeovulum sp.]MDP3862813.1 LysR family transcriptional regulator [Phaeovulum sp.]MDZ4117798.1 LysR family transcriptional regulator [Phaeovulum sp.]
MTEIDWHRMPALAALRAFEATARCGGFSAAARQLNVTHAAVAQQVRALEDELGVQLVWRDGRALRMTPEGEKLGLALNVGFAALQEGLAALSAEAGQKPLTVTLPPAFAAEWLMPRLARFWKRHPDISLSLLPDHRVLDLQNSGAAMGIRFGDGHWPGVRAEFLTPALQVVVGAPELLGGRRTLTLAEMTALPWVRERDWPEQMDWLKSIGLRPDALRFTEFPNEELALSAVREGLGLHLESAALVEEDIASGRLVQICELSHESLGYYAVFPPGPVSAAAQAFVAWLKAEL